MTTIWNDKTKPSGTAYTNVSPTGKTEYDDPTVIYDSPEILYDGFNPFAWNNIAKPVSSVWTYITKPT